MLPTKDLLVAPQDEFEALANINHALDSNADARRIEVASVYFLDLPSMPTSVLNTPSIVAGAKVLIQIGHDSVGSLCASIMPHLESSI